MERTQIYLSEGQQRALDARAAGSGRTRSDLIREAIDDYLGVEDPEAERLRRFRDAVDAAFGGATHLPDGATFVSELRRRDRVRADALDARRGSST